MSGATPTPKRVDAEALLDHMRSCGYDGGDTEQMVRALAAERDAAERERDEEREASRAAALLIAQRTAQRIEAERERDELAEALRLIRGIVTPESDIAMFSDLWGVLLGPDYTESLGSRIDALLDRRRGGAKAEPKLTMFDMLNEFGDAEVEDMRDD